MLVLVQEKVLGIKNMKVAALGPNPIQFSHAGVAMPMEHALCPLVRAVTGLLKVRKHLFTYFGVAL